MLFEKFYNSKGRIFIFLIFLKYILLQERINKHILDKQFAIWRVDAPWLPRTKKAQGAVIFCSVLFFFNLNTSFLIC